MSRTTSGGMLLAFALFVGSQGCAVRGSDDRGAELQLEIARLRAAEQAERVAELEARLSRIESGDAARPSDTNRTVLERLDRLITLNEAVLTQAAPLTSAAETESAAAAPPSSAASSVCDPMLSPEVQLKRLVEHMRGRRSAWRGGLSREEAEALRVLLRPERPLDPNNPLRHW